MIDDLSIELVIDDHPAHVSLSVEPGEREERIG